MIIRSQDKKTITNFRNITDIAVVAHDNEFKICVYYPFSVYEDNDYSKMYLGTYSTEEKAIKVLDMIQNAYTQYGTIKDGFGNIHWAFNIPKFFQMPSDEEVEV